MIRQSKFTESQIMAILADGDSLLPVGKICRKHAISSSAYYQWQKQVRRDVGGGAKASKGARSRERASVADVCRPGARKRSDQGRSVAKVVTPAPKRKAIDVMVKNHRLSVARACKIVRLSRSAHDEATTYWEREDSPADDALNEIVAKRSR